MVAYNNNYGGNSAPATANRSGPSGEEPWRPYQQGYTGYLDEDDDDPVQEWDPAYNVNSAFSGDNTLAETTDPVHTGGGYDPNSVFSGDNVALSTTDPVHSPAPGGGGYDPNAIFSGSNDILSPTDPVHSPGAGGPGSEADHYDAIMEQLMEIIGGGPRDTSAEEGLIQDYYAGKMGAGMGDLAAQFGAGGMGQSGALLGAGADLQGQLARDASRDVLGVQQGARDEFYRNLMNAVGASQAERYLGMDEQQFGMLYDILMQQMGEGEGDGSEGPEFVDEDNDGVDDITGEDRGAQDPISIFGHGSNAAAYLAGMVSDAIYGDGGPGPDNKHRPEWLGSRQEVPSGSNYKGYDESSGQHVWEGPDGQIYYVAGEVRS